MRVLPLPSCQAYPQNPAISALAGFIFEKPFDNCYLDAALFEGIDVGIGKACLGTKRSVAAYPCRGRCA